jgi:hypothetical protein
MVTTGVWTGAAQCTGSITSFLLVRYPRSRGVWCAFLCAAHAAAGPVAEPLDAVAAPSSPTAASSTPWPWRVSRRPCPLR